MTPSIVRNIETIPALPETVREFEAMYFNEDATFEDFENILKKDPLITADIFRIANSPMYGLSRQVTSVRQAISLLGKNSIRAFVLSSVVNTNFKLDLSAYSMTKEQFTTACEKQLALIVNWLIRKKSKQLTKLAPAAFMVDLGRIIISNTLVEKNKSNLLQEALANGTEVSMAERQACGMQATDVTATLFNHWQLDPDIVHIIRYSDDPDAAMDEDKEMAAELRAVRECILPNGEITEASVAVAKATIEIFGLDMEEFDRALEKLLS